MRQPPAAHDKRLVQASRQPSGELAYGVRGALVGLGIGGV